ncbi:GNAT family N-acetyltransferase [Knoellia locipacati]|uniref:GNAT family N-acetyltransferase n=1 Tax=Knoellia locipacati TaxID=882824 RepID=UPI00384D4C3E
METVPMTEVPRTALRRYYDELMQPAFAPAELMTWDELDEALASRGTEGLLLLDDGEPVAGLVTEDYLDASLLLLAYVVVSSGHRGQGLGSRLIRRAVGHEPRLVLAEIEDPRFHEAHEHGGDPSARVRFYDRLGSHLLAIPYTQPSLRPGSPRVDDLLLITIPSAAPPAEVDGGLLRAFLDEYYGACEGEDVVVGDPSYRALRGSVPDRLPLSRLDELDLARPGPSA